MLTSLFSIRIYIKDIDKHFSDDLPIICYCRDLQKYSSCLQYKFVYRSTFINKQDKYVVTDNFHLYNEGMPLIFIRTSKKDDDIVNRIFYEKY